MERERNKFLEFDGLYWESDSHEWFNDKNSTEYARKKSILWSSGEQEDSLKVHCFITRDKETGEYDRVIIDDTTNKIIYITKSLEDLSSMIDKLKIVKRFNHE